MIFFIYEFIIYVFYTKKLFLKKKNLVILSDFSREGGGRVVRVVRVADPLFMRILSKTTYYCTFCPYNITSEL